jgi:predicted Zn finger-like uncharacterized protein
MVLATRCPHCRTTFRVVQDQLKLRGGLVRCGACKEIFNGAENLLRPREAVPPPATGDTAGSRAELATPTPTPGAADAASAPAASAGLHAPAPVPSYPAPPQSPDEPHPDPLLRMTLMDFSVFHDEAEQAPAQPDFSLPRMAASTASSTPAAESGDDLSRAIDDLKSKPWRGMSSKRARHDEDAIDALDSGEPEFVVRARRQQRLARSTRIGLVAGSAALALLLAFQLLYQFRVPLAAGSPAAATMLAGICRLAGCSIGLPAQIDMVTIESSELQALPSSADTFTLVMLLRNRSAVRQQWPYIELTLNDASEAAVARRVITPRDYLPPSQDPAQGFAPNSEQSARLVMNLAQVKAAGFRAYLFYP